MSTQTTGAPASTDAFATDDPIRLMQIAQAAMARACLATRDCNLRARRQSAEAAIYDALIAAEGRIDPSAAALAPPVGVPESVRELLGRPYSTEEQRRRVSDMVTNSDRGETLARVVTDAEVLHEIRALLSTPSGRAAPPVGGGQKIIDGLNDAIAFANGDTSRGRLLRVEDGKVVDVTPPVGGGAVEQALAEFQRRNGYHKPVIEELLTEFGELLLTRVSAAPEPAAGGGREIVRHRKGGVYEVLGEAEAQVSVGKGWRHLPTGVDLGDAIPARLIYDGLELTVLRNPDTGKLWCRFPDEMRDGRFEMISAPSEAETAGGDEGTEWFWRIVDAHGLGNVPSFEQDALRLLCWKAAAYDELRASDPAPANAGAEGGQA